MHVAFGMTGSEGNGGAERHEPDDPLGVIGRDLDGPERPTRERDEHGLLGRGGIEDGEGVGGKLEVSVGGAVRRTVGAAVPSTVEGDDPEVPGQIRNLRLPHARVDDGPCGREQRRWPLRAFVAENLKEDPHAIAADEPVAVGVTCAHAVPLPSRARP